MMCVPEASISDDLSHPRFRNFNQCNITLVESSKFHEQLIRQSKSQEMIFCVHIRPFFSSGGKKRKKDELVQKFN